MSGDRPLDTAFEIESEQHALDSGEAGPKVIRGGAARSAAYVAGILLGLISTPPMVRHLGVADFGRYVTVGSLIFVISALTEAGLGSVGVREFSTRDEAGGARLVRNLIGLRIVLSGLAMAGAVAFGLVAGYDHVLIVGILISGAGLWLTNWFGVYIVPLTATLRLGWLAALDLIRQFITSVAIVALVLAGAALTPFWTAQPLGTAVAVVVVLLLVRGLSPMRPAFDLDQWWMLLKESLPWAAAVAMSVLYFRVGVILSSLISSEAQTGYYSLAFRIVELASGVPALLAGSVLPIFSRAALLDQERLGYALGRTYQVSFILGVWVALAIGLGSPVAVSVVGGKDEFGPSVAVLSVLGVAMVGTFLLAAGGQVLLALRRQRALLLANGAAMVVGTGLAVVLISAHGALGAAIATTATELGLALVYLALVASSGAGLRPPLGSFARVLIVAAVAAAVPLLLGVPALASVPIATVILFGGVWMLGGIPPEVGDAMRLRRSTDA